MDTKHIDELVEFITNARTYGHNGAWCIGYVQAFYNTGLITSNELETLIKTITTLYA